MGTELRQQIVGRRDKGRRSLKAMITTIIIIIIIIMTIIIVIIITIIIIIIKIYTR